MAAEDHGWSGWGGDDDHWGGGGGGGWSGGGGWGDSHGGEGGGSTRGAKGSRGKSGVSQSQARRLDTRVMERQISDFRESLAELRREWAGKAQVLAAAEALQNKVAVLERQADRLSHELRTMTDVMNQRFNKQAEMLSTMQNRLFVLETSMSASKTSINLIEDAHKRMAEAVRTLGEEQTTSKKRRT